MDGIGDIYSDSEQSYSDGGEANSFEDAAASFSDAGASYSDEEDATSASFEAAAAPAVSAKASANPFGNIQSMMEFADMVGASVARNMLSAQNGIHFSTSNEELGVKERRVKFSFAGSLQDLADSKERFARAVFKGDRNTFGKEINVLDIKLVGYRNHMPCALSVTAEHFPGEKLNNETNAINEQVMCDMSQGEVVFPSPISVYKSNANSFSQDFARDYPKVDPENIGAGISPHPKDKSLVQVPDDHPALKIIRESRRTMGQELSKASYVPQFETWVVSKEECSKSIKTLEELLADSNEKIARGDLYLAISRSNLSQNVFDSRGSMQTNEWIDPTGLSCRLKDGQTLIRDLTRKGTLEIEAVMRYRDLEKQ